MSSSSSQQKQEKTLNKADFESKIQLVGLRVPNTQLSTFCKVMQKFMFKGIKCKNVIELEDNNTSKLVLLMDQVKQKDLSDLPEPAQQVLKQFGSLPVQIYETTIGYDQMSAGKKKSNNFFMCV